MKRKKKKLFLKSQLNDYFQFWSKPFIIKKISWIDKAATKTKSVTYCLYTGESVTLITIRRIEALISRKTYFQFIKLDGKNESSFLRPPEVPSSQSCKHSRIIRCFPTEFFFIPNIKVNHCCDNSAKCGNAANSPSAMVYGWNFENNAN